jgi:integrase
MIGSSRFQNGSLKLVKNKKTAGTWFLRFYEYAGGKRVYRNRKIGTVRDYPHRRDAEKAVLALRANINSGVRSPETVGELITHYLKHELTPEHKAFSTVEVNGSVIKLYIEPQWGKTKLSDVRTVVVEKWLSTTRYAPATRSKIRAVFSALFAHAIRHEWVQHNPITAVRCSAKRLREKDVLTPAEFGALLGELSVRDRAMVLLAGSTGLRRSEFIALTWADIDTEKMEVRVTRSCVRNRIGATKTEGSAKPVPLHGLVLAALREWKSESAYRRDQDFLFPSIRKNGTQPLSPDMLLKRIIRPALVQAGVTGKVIGWHSLRHSLATNLRSLGVDVKVAQELLRHVNSRTTLDLYTHAVSSQKREANDRVLDLLLPSQNRVPEAQHRLALSADLLEPVSC